MDTEVGIGLTNCWSKVQKFKTQLHKSPGRKFKNTLVKSKPMVG